MMLPRRKIINSACFGIAILAACCDANEKESSPSSKFMIASQVTRQSNDANKSIAIDCDFNNDPCTSQFNRVCEADDKCPANTDCFDCDPCQQFHYDCKSCVENGCVWCPTDAFCSSSPLESPVWQRIEFFFHTKVSSSCLQADDWISTCPTEDNVYQDPLYDANSWAYDLLQVEPVWKRGIQGSGVRVRINDVGVDHLHPEFRGRFNFSASCDHYAPRGTHGTAVASLVAAAADNDHCAVGIAPNATLSACLMSLSSQIHPERLATVLDSKVEDMDISVNAWGIATCMPRRPPQRRRLQPPRQSTECKFRRDHSYSPCHFCNFGTHPDTPSSPSCLNAILYYCALNYEKDDVACSQYLDVFTTCGYSALTTEQQAALSRGIDEGRNGKGVIFVFSAGNSFGLGVDVNFDGFVNSRYTLSVGAVGKDGKHASYSTTGAALFVTGPGGDRESLTNNIVAQPGPGNQCGDVTVGTSFSAPYVAGLIALMLEVNPELSWRDVQGILAQTSTQSEPEDDSWGINGAGFHHSYKYGFGIANAEAAINASEAWELWDREEEIIVDSGTVNVPIVDDPDKMALSTVSVNSSLATGLAVESVVVKLDLVHASRGDLTVILTSPEGTESILHPGKRPENTVLTGDQRWELMTVRNWGESAVGNWSLSFVDVNEGILDECIDEPFTYTWEDEDAKLVWTCTTLEMVGACVRGALLQSFAQNLITENRTAARAACCACGGGRPASTESFLRSWQLIVYGHERNTHAPSAAPSCEPTDQPADTPSSLDRSQSVAYGSPETMALRSGAPGGSSLLATLWFIGLFLSFLQV